MYSTCVQTTIARVADEIQTRITSELIQSRCASGLSKDELGAKIGRDGNAISLLEQGLGSVESLVSVMTVLNFKLVGIGAGGTLAMQLADRRIKGNLSIEQLASETGLTVQTIALLERGRGTLTDLFPLLAVLAPTVRRRAGTPVWAGKNIIDRDSRFTCPKFMAAIYEAFGPVALDPCGNASSPVIATRRILLEEGGNGLIDEWTGGLAFVNPPFSSKDDWLRRAFAEWSEGNVDTVLFLSPTMADNGFFEEIVSEHADIFFPRGRLKFTDPNGKEEASKYGLWLVALGATARQKSAFAKLVKGRWYHQWSSPVPARNDLRAYSCEPSSRAYRVACGPPNSFQPGI